MTRRRNIPEEYSSTSGSSCEVIPFPAQQVRRTLSDNSASWRLPVLSRLEELVRLEPGWDGYRGVPVSFENAAFALQILDLICSDEVPAPQIVPGSSGDIQIEWHNMAGDVELHIRAPNDVHAWKCMGGDKEEGEELELTNDFLEVIRWIMRMTELTVAARSATA